MAAYRNAVLKMSARFEGLEFHHVVRENNQATDILYRYPGLPPTPIANPGMTAITAALDPEITDYYYYALSKENRHRFFTNYNDHLNFVNSGEYYAN